MTTACCLPAARVISLHTPWWRRALAVLATLRRRARVRQPPRGQPHPAQPCTWAPADWRTLRHLSAGTLRDIGAPEWVHAGRDRQRDAALDLLRL